MMSIDNCPIREDAERTIELSKDFLKALAKLRRSLKKCKDCPEGQDCKLLREWNQQITQAITEVNEEWGLLDGS